MPPRVLRPSVVLLILALLATLTVGVAAAQVNPLVITAPAQHSVLTAGPVGVRGTFDLPTSEEVNVVYVVDVSSSTEEPEGQDCNGDQVSDVLDDYNGDGDWGTTLDCEISGIVALNASLAGRPGVHVALVAFAATASAASTFAGAQGLPDATFITPPEADTPDEIGVLLQVEPDGGVPDLVNIATSLDTHRINLFTRRSLAAGTEFDPALAAVDDVLDVPRGRSFVFLLSDGDGDLSDGPGTPLDALAQRGATVSTFSVGGDGAGCGDASPLRVIADRTGGACSEQADPSGLSAVLGDLAPPTLDHIEIDLGDGSEPQIAELDPLGNWSFTYPDLQPGDYDIVVIAHLRDGTTRSELWDFEVVSEQQLDYVALGDSYSAGEGLDPFAPDDHGRECHRSQTQAYPSKVLVGGVAPSASWTGFTFEACSGARMRDILSRAQHGDGDRPQIAAVGPDANLVTMTIGGNDANFVDILSFCALNTPLRDCQHIPYQRLSSGRTLSLHDWANLRLALLQNEVTQLYKRVREETQGNAQVLAAGYPQFFGVNRRERACPEFTAFRGGERAFLNTATQELNRRLSLAAASAGIQHVAVDPFFENFRICDRPTSATEYLTGAESPINNWSWALLDPVGPGSFHPTEEGQDAYAAAFTAQLASVPTPQPQGGARSLQVTEADPPVDGESLLGPLPDLTDAELAEVAVLEANSLALGSIAEVLGQDPCAGIAVPQQQLVLQGDGYLPRAEISVRLSSSGEDAGAYPGLAADAGGVVRAGIVVPSDAVTGQDYDLALQGPAAEGATQRLSARFQVQPQDSDCGQIARDTGQLATGAAAPGAAGLPLELQAPVLTSTAPAVPEAPATGVRRVAGADRIATSIAISQESFETATAVVLATSGRYPDALAGAPFATSLEAPLLLTPADALDARVLAEIRRLGAEQVVLLGGEAALAPGVAADLATAGLAVERIGGATRFDTAAAIAGRLDADEVVLVEGANPDPRRGWPDAVSAAGLAASEGMAILLTEHEALPAATAEALDGETAVMIVGGAAAVGEAVAAEVDSLAAATRRLGGADRYATSRLVAEEAQRRGLDLNPLWIATGNDFPDALSAGAAAGIMNTTVLLLDGHSTALSAESEAWFDAHLPPSAGLLVAGGPQAVSEELFASLGLLSP